MSYCNDHPRVSRFILNCYAPKDNTPIHYLLLLFGILYLITGFLGILYTIAKEVPLSDLFAGVYTISEIVQQISSGRICDEIAIDIWSIPHFIGHSFLVVLIYRFSHNDKIALLISTLISVIWEGIERIIVIYAYNFACESWINSIVDIIIGFLGSLLAFYLLTLKITNKKN